MSFLGVVPATDAEHEAAIEVLEVAGCADSRWVVDDAARYGWDADTLMTVARDLVRRRRRQQEVH